MNMAVLALVVAGASVGGLIALVGLVAFMRSELRDLRVQVHDLQVVEEAEQVFARAIGKRRWGVIRGGKTSALFILAAVSAVARNRQLTTAATAGASVAAGALVLTAMTPTELSRPTVPEAQAAVPTVVHESDYPTPVTTLDVPADGEAMPPQPFAPEAPSTTVAVDPDSPSTTAPPLVDVTTTTLTIPPPVPTTLPLGDGLPVEDENGRPIAPPGMIDLSAAVVRLPQRLSTASLALAASR